MTAGEDGGTRLATTFRVCQELIEPCARTSAFETETETETEHENEDENEDAFIPGRR